MNRTHSPRSGPSYLSGVYNFSNKEEANKLLETISTLQGLPPHLSERARDLQKRVNSKNQPWDEIKPELESLQLSLQQSTQVQLQTLRDTRLDILAKKINELEITKQVKDDVTAEMERTKKRLVSDIDDNFNKIRQLKEDLAERDQTIADLKERVQKLTTEKQELEKKIIVLENEIGELKQDVENLQATVAEKDRKIESLMEIHSKRLETMADKIDELETKNKELAKMNANKIVVGETMKIIVTAIYKHVHPTLNHRKRNSYSVFEIGDHLHKRYFRDPDEKRAAEERWERLKGRSTLISTLNYEVYRILSYSRTETV